MGATEEMTRSNCVFCNFLSGKKKEHKNGFPFMKLHETKYSVSFLSIDFPTTEDGHCLVIPKKHYRYVEDIPPHVMADVAIHMQLLAKALKTKNSGCNILLNDGKAAGQTVWHAHFHLVPRNVKDGIILEGWKRKKISPQSFKKIYTDVKNSLNKVKKN